ncbi:MAG: AAA family ATPase, partial [Desulforhabdus sp.]|nr:AAA family ATPase [Desulforhabdus sp.]
MRVFEIQLISFGPFTGHVLRLMPVANDMHIVYGPNEAGKSAALRALTALLFGIPVRTADNFLHDNQNLRIGGRIKDSAGDELFFVRRKGRKDTLLDESGKPIPESILERFLQGVGEEFFTSMFGIGHETLIRGGEQILKGGGVIGESLFAAGMGGTNIRDVIRELDDEAGRLFLPKGKVQLIASNLSAYREARQTSLRASLSGREWVEHDQALRSNLLEKERIDLELRRLQSDKTRLQRLQKALPGIAERRELLARLDALGQFKILSPSFAKKRRELLSSLDKARESEMAAAEALARIKTKISTLIIPEGLIQQGEIIVQLVERLGSHRKAFKDLPRLRGEKAQLKTDVDSIVRELLPNGALGEVESLRIAAPRRARIRELGNSCHTLQDRVRMAAREVKKCEARLAVQKAALAAMDAPREPAALRSAVSRALQEGKIEQELSAAIEELKAGEKVAEVELKKLGLWSGTLDELEAVPLPSPETINRFDLAFSELDRKLLGVQDRIKQLQTRRADLQVKFRALQLAGPVPTEQDLENARRRREQGWRLICLAWQEGLQDNAAIESFDSEKPLAVAYEKSVFDADQIADRLRREADRVAQQAGLISQLKGYTEELQDLQEGDRIIREKIDRLSREWADTWLPAGIRPLTPNEMRAWSAKQERLVQQSAKLKEGRKRIGTLKNRIEHHVATLTECLKTLGELLPGSEEALES